MKRLLLVSVVLLALPHRASGAFQVPPYQPLRIEARVPPYQVKADLSNVTNLNQYGKFTKLQESLLARQSFFVAPGDDRQLFFVYEQNDYKVIPNFVASDSVLQLYHIFYDYSLRHVEAEKLNPLLRRLTKHMLRESLSTYNHLAPGDTRDAALRNVAYFAVAAKVLGLIPGRLPAAAERMVAEEWKEISAHAGRRPSRIFPYQVDFSQFVPRGHYAGGEDLKHYFMAMTWYGVLPFALEWPERATPPEWPMSRSGSLCSSPAFSTRPSWTVSL